MGGLVIIGNYVQWTGSETMRSFALKNIGEFATMLSF
jgi:hypothetical protein